jgi:methylase of polypeptide subunit release factors
VSIEGEHREFGVQDGALLALGRELRSLDYRFSTVTPLTCDRVNRRHANREAKDLAGIFGWSRPFHSDRLPGRLLDLMRTAGVITQDDGRWRSTVRLSSLGPQLFFHSAYPTQSADAVFFGPDTVRFAHAIGQLLRTERGPITRAVDVGCGAGPGGLVMAAAAPSAQIVLGDINDEALRLARVNAALNGCANVAVVRSDILAATEGLFDVVVSNPPYLVDAAERTYRHGGGALGEGLSLAILEQSLLRLAPAGSLLLYTGSAIVDGRDGFREAAARILAQTGWDWSYVEWDPDVFGEELEGGPYAEADRIAAVVLTVTRPA